MTIKKRSPAPLRTGTGRDGTNVYQLQPQHTKDSAKLLLDRLDGVKETGPNTWMARSPCRDDRTPSLSIKKVDDRLPIHDFGGNSPDEIMRAVGLSMTDLFDRPLQHHNAPVSCFQRKRYGQARDALKALRHEVALVWCFAEQMHAGFALDPDERQRLKLSMHRLQVAEELAA